MYKSIQLTLKIACTAILVFAIVIVIWFLSGEGVAKPEQISWGVTFSPRQTDYLGLDTGQVFIAILDDMKVRHLRLMAPWYEIEPENGEYDFSRTDWFLAEAAKRDAKVILAVGRKLFRWPECHEPAWTHSLALTEFEDKLLAVLREEINHFKKYNNIVSWQVENEVLLPFGECAEPKPNWELFKKEVALVRSLDSRPVISTESGELSAWLKIGSVVDQLGVSLYRATFDSLFGTFYYPFRPGFYQKKALFTQAINRNLQKVFLSELQLEPWGEKPIGEMSLSEQLTRMSLERTTGIIDYASHTGFDEIYIWGAEWWYWLKKVHKDDRYWELGKTLF